MIYELDDTNFDEFVKEHDKVIVDFHATWCPPCRRMNPVFKSLSEKYPNVMFASVDVDKSPNITQRFGIMSIPYFVLVASGKPQSSVIGAKISDLENLVKTA